jgi:hypothetical protein
MIGFRLTMVLMPCGTGGLRAALHHDRRADGDALVDVRVPLDRLADTLGHHALDACRAIVGADDELVAHGAKLVLPEHQLAIAEADHADDAMRRSP